MGTKKLGSQFFLIFWKQRPLCPNLGGSWHFVKRVYKVYLVLHDLHWMFFEIVKFFTSWEFFNLESRGVVVDLLRVRE